MLTLGEIKVTSIWAIGLGWPLLTFDWRGFVGSKNVFDIFLGFFADLQI